jgi:hypothetical protein
MARISLFPPGYWTNLEVTQQDVEFLHSHLFENETPLTPQELVPVLVAERIRAERAALEARHKSSGVTYVPRDVYQPGTELVFPALDWKQGRVSAVRAGLNPSVGEFDVITVEMQGGGERLFAARLAEHELNEAPVSLDESEDVDVEAIAIAEGVQLAGKIEEAFEADQALVRIAGRWFPRALLVDVNVGHLNLAEAVLDMKGGEPQTTASLLKEVEMPAGVNPKLAEFSLNFALQEDERFDEVGPAGQVLWALRRLEPEGVRETPKRLQYEPISHERTILSDQMLALELQLDDELSPIHIKETEKVPASVTMSLIYPHLREGTLPLSPRARSFFPTAYESPRVRFMLVDGKSGLKMPAWVVRNEGYIYGLRDWYKAQGLMPGSLVEVKHGAKPGEVIVQARTQRSTKDWIRTLMVGADGGMVFAMLKQPINAEFNDRMAIYVPDQTLLDPLWGKQRSFPDLVYSMMRELTKLTPQGHVHAQELYAALNLVRRVPPAPMLAALVEGPFTHVGDLHFRIEDGA